MLKHKSRKMEFLALFIMVIGTVIGSGIYVKNKALLTDTQNPIISIVLWGIVGIVCMMSVYVFIEIASSTKNHGNGTIGNWAKLFINRKVASFFSILYLVAYVPAAQSIFTAMFVTYFFAAIGKPISVGIQVSVLLVVGIILLIGFAIINAYKKQWADKIQIYATVFKFIPLFIALIAGFAMVSTDLGAMWNNGNYPGSPTEGTEAWSSTKFGADLFVRGFGGVLFAFDGFIYVANKQRDIKDKEVLSKSLIFGMAFIAIFYVLMAVSLFLGSQDGSIVKLLERVFSGGVTDNQTAISAARIISNICLMLICLQGINIFTMIGTRGMESDANAKLVYSKNRNIGYPKAAFIQVIFSIVLYSVFILIGAFTLEGGIGLNYDSWTHLSSVTIDSNWTDAQKYQAYLGFTNDGLTLYVGIMSSTASAFGFLMITATLGAGLINRFTKKVKTEQVKGFLWVGIPSVILMAFFVGCSFFGFLVPSGVLHGGESWIGSQGMWFLILVFVTLIICLGIYLFQEHKFKNNPFKNGFIGEITDEERILKVRNRR
ncbi:amino acid permease [Williamsoniiplasma somnilux]|uniref:Amino acid permease n=1 Tax=Williamsoniiplasma somnilux TaxID=215578 RepID=A0A2K8NX83_9MOLU|nr:APC family permease [Williamsoniiplasma somnilux]ATZ18455.1 amino acid permease [Williamsoniiplasma somnilux]